MPAWVNDPEVWLGLFVMFGLPTWYALSRNDARAALSWRAFKIALGMFWALLVFGTLLDMAGFLPPSVSAWLAGFWPKKH